MQQGKKTEQHLLSQNLSAPKKALPQVYFHGIF